MGVFWRTATANAVLEIRSMRRESMPVAKEMANPFTLLGPSPGVCQKRQRKTAHSPS